MMIKHYLLIFLFLPIFSYGQSTKDSTENDWSGLVSGYYYFIPEENIQPTITGYVDHKNLHIEGRFDYEDANTFSLFAGYNWEKDGTLKVSVTPMAGIAVGRTNGLLPGLEFNIDYKCLNLYSENEYMLDFKGRQKYFFYSWTEFNTVVYKNLKAGVLAQSLRWFHTKFDIQRGVYTEYSLGNFTFDFYYFNPFTDSHFIMAASSFSF